MSRFPARARVLRTSAGWTVLYPGGRKYVFNHWWIAMSVANHAALKEREFEAAKARDPWNDLGMFDA